jgi:hypothetical protein
LPPSNDPVRPAVAAPRQLLNDEINLYFTAIPLIIGAHVDNITPTCPP